MASFTYQTDHFHAELHPLLGGAWQCVVDLRGFAEVSDEMAALAGAFVRDYSNYVFAAFQEGTLTCPDFCDESTAVTACRCSCASATDAGLDLGAGASEFLAATGDADALDRAARAAFGDDQADGAKLRLHAEALFSRLVVADLVTPTRTGRGAEIFRRIPRVQVDWPRGRVAAPPRGATRIVRGGGRGAAASGAYPTRRRRLASPFSIFRRGVAAPPRLPRVYSEGGGSRRCRGCRVDYSEGGVAVLSRGP